MASGVVLSTAAAKRIAAAVRKVERTPQDLAGRGQPAEAAALQFWAQLTGEDPENPGRYSFAKRVPDGFDLAASAPAFASSEYQAKEINAVPGLSGRAAWLTLVGYDDQDPPKPIYYFEAGPPYFFVVKILAVAGGAAVYTGTHAALDPAAEMDASSAWSGAVGSGAHTCYFANDAELPNSGSATGHKLDPGERPIVALGFRCGTNASDGKPFFRGSIIQVGC